MLAFWRVFIINGCWILPKAFSTSIEIIIWFLSFNLLIWCITLTDLWILKNPCIPGISHLVMMYKLFNVIGFCLLWFCWGFLHPCLSVIFAGSFLFLLHFCLVLVLGWWWPHRVNLGVDLPLQFSGRVWVG